MFTKEEIASIGEDTDKFFDAMIHHTGELSSKLIAEAVSAISIDLQNEDTVAACHLAIVGQLLSITHLTNEVLKKLGKELDFPHDMTALLTSEIAKRQQMTIVLMNMDDAPEGVVMEAAEARGLKHGFTVRRSKRH